MKKEFIIWTKKLSVGIKELDDQHKHFIGLMNEAYRIHEKKDRRAMGKELNELIEYARIHFTTEERYFDKWDYPYKEEHIEKHANILQELLKYLSDFEKGKCDCEDFLNFLKDWLENHLKIYDLKYAKYFKENNYI